MIERLLAAEAALERGDIETAEHLFRQVSDADPRNAIAVAGLARCAERRGAAADARALARRALEIDPDEAAARRLLAELDEPRAAARAEPPPSAPRWRRWLSRLLRRG